MRNIVVVGTFESRADAEQVAELLCERGIDRSDIDIHTLDREQRGTAGPREETSWWDWLFGESEQRSHYTDNVRGGGAVLAVTADDPHEAARARHLMEAEGGDVEAQSVGEPDARGQERAGQRPLGAGSAEVAADREAVLPVTEERLKVGKRPVARGGVRIYRRMSERPVEEQVRLREEHVNVERRPVDRPAGDAVGAFRDEVIEITEMGEEAIVAKEVRVVEEVVVNKDVRERDETVTERVRRSDVEVDRSDDAGDEDFRRHWAESGRFGGARYEEYDPAYRFGRQLGGDAQGAGEWSSIEADARRRWEERSPGTWERFKDAIRYAWEGGRGGGHRRAA
jgi:uncharacterized protein (TIGR02271 family)